MEQPARNERRPGLGRFFAAKLRAAIAYALFTQSGDTGLLWEALVYQPFVIVHWPGGDG